MKRATITRVEHKHSAISAVVEKRATTCTAGWATATSVPLATRRC